LPKFTKAESELSNIRDKWLYFIKNAGTLDYVPKNLNEALKKAVFLLGYWVKALREVDRKLTSEIRDVGQKVESHEDRIRFLKRKVACLNKKAQLSSLTRPLAAMRDLDCEGEDGAWMQISQWQTPLVLKGKK